MFATRTRKKINRERRPGARTLVALLLLALLLAVAPGVVNADKQTELVRLVNGSTGKREVVYAKLDASGKVERIYLVNHFHPRGRVNLTDYGDYERVTQLTGDAVPVLTGDKVTMEGVEGHYYYQGDLKSRELPWAFDISYRLDGQVRSAGSLSGARGQLEISLSIQQNGLVDRSFVDQYALQISIPIDPDRALLVAASPGGVVSYAGSTHQLTYMVLPGSESLIKVLLEVDDFAMDQVVIAGVPLSFDLDLSELEEELEPLQELSDGIAQLDQGARRLNAGYKELLEGYKALQQGSRQLAAGSSQLKEGSGKLTGGLSEYAAGVAQYAQGVKDLSSGYGAFDSGLGELQTGAKTLLSRGQELKAGSAEILAGLTAMIDRLPDDLSGFSFSEEELARLDALLAAAGGIKEGLNELAAGAQGLHGGLSQLKGQLQGALDEAQGSGIPGTAPLQMTSDQWCGYLTGPGPEGLGLTGSPENLTRLAGELAGLSQAAVGYHSAATALHGKLVGLLGGLLDDENGIPALEAGAGQLSGGITALAAGYSGYTDGEGAYQPGLYDGLAALVGQIKGLAAASGPLLNDFGQLTAGLIQLKEGYAGLHYGLSLYVNDGVGGLVTGLAGKEGQPGLTGASSQVKEGLQALGQGGSALGAAGSELSAGLSELDQGLAGLVTGLSGLRDGLDQYQRQGLQSYAKGLGDFAAGMGELESETSGLKEQFMEALEERLAEFTGENFEVKSFASPRNTEVASVQFVIMTAEIPPVEE